MTIVLDVSFNDQSSSDSQNSAINEISRKKEKDKRHESASKANKAAKIKSKVSWSMNSFVFYAQSYCSHVYDWPWLDIIIISDDFSFFLNYKRECINNDRQKRTMEDVDRKKFLFQ